ncbi:response regulator [Devosia sp. LjRoot3]|uniref:response regulator n=1 Tax=Devosia sp. LjRoot3 TaxID=3342319 RepID=UPI003ECCCF82
MSKFPKVHVVEDEALIRFNISDHLAQSGYQVLEATNAGEAFEVLESEQGVGVIITDIAMPGPVDGLMLAKFVTERWPHLRVIVISGQQKAGVRDLPDGTAFLSKPFGLDEISTLMAALGYAGSSRNNDDDAGPQG